MDYDEVLVCRATTGKRRSHSCRCHPMLVHCGLSLLTIPLDYDEVLVCSIKVEVKKKHISLGWNFACFAAHVIEQDLL
jgi:hypothetical protein